MCLKHNIFSNFYKFILSYLMPNKPISNKFGYDRGNPIDRYYIEKFLRGNSSLIAGDVLEIADATYTNLYGADRVKRSMVLSYQAGENVDFIADLTTGVGVPENVADCFILTQTFPFVFELKASVSNALRVLRPGGVLLITVPGITQISKYDYERWGQYWSFTDLSLIKLFNDEPIASIDVKTYGNVKVACAFMYGFATHELREKDLDFHDNSYQLSISAVVRKAL
jgi:SAM-dependent methyltransferase